MEERIWTKEQLSAIETRDKTLLVSAAAGSGKTATLTERIIRSLTDEKNPENIDSILVVTFTVTAAGELREKISKALKAELAKHPSDKRLERQLYMLPAAKICTIDSFCNDVLKQNTDRVGISPNYRLADAAECELIATSILEGLIEAVYNGELPEISSAEDFERLCDCITDSKRTEEAADVFRLIYNKCESCEEGVDSLLPLIEKYKMGEAVEKTPFGEYLMEISRSAFSHYSEVLSDFKVELSSGNCGELACFDTAELDKKLMDGLLAKDTYEGLREALSSLKFPSKGKVTANDVTELTENYAAFREVMKEDVGKLSKLFAYTTEQWTALSESLYELFGVFYRFLKKFAEHFADEKRKRGGLSFADIERYAYNCLISDGKPTDIAKNISERYTSIYIDEYQDVNGLQNRIFEAISRPRNRFMVGDIKQSIYCFRAARPEIFAGMKTSFPPLESSQGDEATVFMSSNFRCDRGIVDFVNGVFDRVFSLIGDSIGYGAGDRLTYAKVYKGGEPAYLTPEVYALPHVTGEGITREAAIVAKKISELLDGGVLNNGEPIKPSDIAIILRDAKGRDVVFVEALKNRGIPSLISKAKDFFLSSEVLLALCFLNSIDNPRRDVYLAGLMCSPLYSFTASDMALIKTERDETLYGSLRKYVGAHPDFKKGEAFLSMLDYYRTVSECISVDKLIFKIYHETGLMSLASGSGGKENLTVLYDYARRFESGGYQGLYSFINFVNSLVDKKTTFDDARAGGDENAVRIVTSHASKGLEYPIVFLVNAGAQIKNKDAENRLAYSQDFGISMRLRTPSGLAIVENPIHSLVNRKIYEKLHEEELRILYVALTRARERLYVIGTSSLGSYEKLDQRIRLQRATLGKYTVPKLSSFLDIILSAGESGMYSVPDEVLISEEDGASDGVMPSGEDAIAEPGIDFAFRDELVDRFTYEYPNKYLTELPEKMSVSKTSPTVLDGSEAEAVTPSEFRRGSRRLPAFADGREADESAKRGIATHYFLQFCDLEGLERVGACEELARLVSLGFISKTDGERVRLDEIESFVYSSLFVDMRGAEKLYRELRFNVCLPADIFTSEEVRKAAYKGQQMLVQGVIDCIIIRRDGSIGLYDYKTDRLSKKELSDRALAEETLKAKHKAQLDMYALAVEQIFGKRPSEVAVYSLALGDTVSMI